jgi:hypothetical protein
VDSAAAAGHAPSHADFAPADQPAPANESASEGDPARHADSAQAASSVRPTVRPCDANSLWESASVQPGEQTPWKIELPLEGIVLDEASVAHSPILPYVAMVASLTERRMISEEELVEGLLESMRQRSMARRTRSQYALHFLHRHPP